MKPETKDANSAPKRTEKGDSSSALKSSTHEGVDLKALLFENEALEKDVSLLRNKLDLRTKEIRDLYIILSEIENSLAWKLSCRLQRFFNGIFPNTGPLGRLNQMARKGIHVWIDDGPKVTSEKIIEKIKLSTRTKKAKTSLKTNMPNGWSSERILFICDKPDLSSVPDVYGDVHMQGWAIADSGIAKIEMYLGQDRIGIANYGLLRPDVANDHPDIKDSDRSGYRFEWDSREFQDRVYDFTVRATSYDGNWLDIVGKLKIDNATIRMQPYDKWINTVELKDIEEAQQRAHQLTIKPLISILMPSYNKDPRLIKRAVGSVLDQVYSNWELCICDDGSTDPEITDTLNWANEVDDRIKIWHAEKNAGISVATNQALKIATGGFVGLMDSDDELPIHALYYIAKLINHDPDVDFIYTDEDKIDMYNRRYEPFFKPDWSPDLFLSCNYLNHFTVLRRDLIDEVGGFRSDYDGSQDYDLYLRIIPGARKVSHIPKILYHWRAALNSTASDPTLGIHAHDAARRALEDYLDQRNIQADVMEGNALGRWRIRYIIESSPKVSIIIPTGGKIELLQHCFETILSRTSYPNYQIIVVDNSSGDAVRNLHHEFFSDTDCGKYIDYRNRSFNFSLMNNYAVTEVNTPLVLFLNDDIEPINDEWLGAMVEQANRSEVGAVGAKLMYLDNTIQHAGVVMGIFQNSGHAFKYLPAAEDQHYLFDQAHIVRNYSAVTAACLMTRREVFLEVGGFEEVHLAVAFQDVDYCLKLREEGYWVVYTPYARLYHHEAKTKAEKIPNPYEVRYMKRKWAHIISDDPYYNPNLTRSSEDFSIDVT